MDYEKKYKEAVGILEFLIGLETVQERGTIQVKDIMNTFPELKSHNDERIRKSLISVFTTHKKEEMYYGTSVDEILEWLDRQGEQKPTDKVEPKFNVYDWAVTDKGDTVQIGAVNNGYYTLFNGMDFNMSYVDKCWHKWTIQDAKAGDVLCYKDEISLYKHDIKNCTKQETTFGGFVYHCCYDGKRFIMDSLYSLTEQDKMDIHPATKEQRDLLFKKMQEAGYEWDTEKKELKKIEQKSAAIIPKFKVGDKIIRKELGGDFIHNPHIIIQVDMLDKKYRLKDGLVAHFSEEDDWELVEQNPAWNKEDEMIALSIEQVMNCASLLNIAPEKIDKIRTCLKAFKDRVQPQNTWKPSEKQIMSLYNSIPNAAFCERETLTQLYVDLKMLLQ